MQPRTILAISDNHISRAECGPDGRWHVDRLLAGKGANTLAADPRRPGVVYAGTQGNGIYQSTDGGHSWSPSGLDGQIVKAIAVSPHDSNVIYAGMKSAALCKSVDGGSTWAELPGFQRIPGRRLWWSPAEPPYYQAYVMAIAVSPGDPNVVLAGIEFGAVVRSEDGGRSWSGHRSGALRDCHALKFHAHYGDWAYEAGGTGGGASVSRDGGRAWRKQKAGLARNYGVACAADPERPEVWYVSVAPGPGNAFSDGPEAYLYRASAGADWQPIGWGPHPLSEMPVALITDPAAPGTLYAGTRFGHVWYSADYGDSWQQLPFRLDGIWLSMVLLPPG